MECHTQLEAMTLVDPVQVLVQAPVQVPLEEHFEVVTGQGEKRELAKEDLRHKLVEKKAQRNKRRRLNRKKRLCDTRNELAMLRQQQTLSWNITLLN